MVYALSTVPFVVLSVFEKLCGCETDMSAEAFNMLLSLLVRSSFWILLEEIRIKL